MTVDATDVRAAANLCRETLEPHVERDWSVLAGGLEWDCRFTVGHISDALSFYAAHLASRSTKWLKFDVVPHDDATNGHLVRLVVAMAEVLGQVLEATPHDVRAFHHSGMWDKSGFAAMGCVETIVHTGDVTQGLGIPFSPPRELCERVVRTLHPEVKEADDWWATLWRGTGRKSTPP